MHMKITNPIRQGFKKKKKKLGKGKVKMPASDRETCPRGRDGLVTQAVVATSARDMSVRAVIGDHPL